jgi:hypothetical protein
VTDNLLRKSKMFPLLEKRTEGESRCNKFPVEHLCFSL